MKHDSNLLDINGGSNCSLTSWANHQLTRMGMIKQMASTPQSKMTVEDFDVVKAQVDACRHSMHSENGGNSITIDYQVGPDSQKPCAEITLDDGHVWIEKRGSGLSK